ncbi:hypothetical protein HUT16_01105 [Kitasatospora sp. NA04385]|uniref:DUF6193 family natural product biosynthesis protein n=1 Tax=Kitasatospora sp. NA04385 TaxID=2742135 RepID=UPI001590E87B|nr:DUF6193 family natural product biosynthesis protein [Kitasatospora sp. NA04385]QKW17846.1 hypothetical protein HUT16_01105 [Kitasatospora sp. NA04385]
MPEVDSPFHEHGPLPDVAPADPAHPLHAYAAHYPEVADAGSLRDALQAVMDREGPGLTVELTSSPGWRHVAAEIEAGDRLVNVLMAKNERCFLVDCWARNVHMASGKSRDLSEVAGAMRSWHAGSRVRELTAQWPFLRTWELAEAHERGEAVPARWAMMRRSAAADTRTRHAADWRDLVEAAFEQAPLRALSPGRSMWWFTLSRRAEPPICSDFPRTRPLGSGRFEVTFADRRVQEVDGAAATVAVIVENLPDDAVPLPAGP